MDLTLNDVANLLNLPGERVKALASEGNIPSYTLGDGIPYFNREEIDAWIVTEKGQMTSARGKGDFCLYRALHHGDVFTGVPAQNKQQLMQAICHLASERMQFDPEVTCELLIDRERLMSTALGSGFALPHPRELIRPSSDDALFIIHPETPIEFGALDGEPVHTLFVLFSGSDRSHLACLAKIGHLLSLKEMQIRVGEGVSKVDLLPLVYAFEKSLV